MKVRSKLGGALLIVMLVLVASNVHAQKKAAGERRDAGSEIDAGIDKHAQQILEDGRRIFRFDTFGSEAFWGATLQLHKAIAGEKNGGAAAA